jgi:hypothetical protein
MEHGGVVGARGSFASRKEKILETHLRAPLRDDQHRKHGQRDAALREDLSLGSLNGWSRGELAGHVPRPRGKFLLHHRTRTQHVSVLDPVIRHLALRPLHEAPHEHDVVRCLDLSALGRVKRVSHTG